MIRQIVLEDRRTAKKSVGLVMTSDDIGDYEMARLGERLLRAGGPQRGYLGGGVRYQFRSLDEEVPGLEYQTMRVDAFGYVGVNTHLTHQQIVEIELLLRGDPRPNCPGIPSTSESTAPATQPSSWGDLVDLEGRPCDRADTIVEQMMRADGVTDDPADFASLPADTYREDVPRATVDISDGRRVDVKLTRHEAAACADVVAKARAAAEKYPPRAMTGLLPNPRPCDRVPWWLWPAAAAVVIGLIAAGVR